MPSVIEIPEDLAHELDRLAGAELCRDVRRNKQREALRLSSGCWNPADHPELAEGGAAYVDRIRSEEDEFLKEFEQMAGLDWSQCPDVESIPGKVSGAWVFRGTRMPVQTVFENLEAGMSVEEITEVFDVTPEEVKAVLHFASESLAKAPTFG
jgi:uncharacterized protein (DUF433 family)